MSNAITSPITEIETAFGIKEITIRFIIGLKMVVMRAIIRKNRYFHMTE